MVTLGHHGLASKIVVMIIIAEAAGALGSLVTFPAISTWYSALIKPPFSPPNFLFGPVWTMLYALMGIAAGLIWNSKSKKKSQALKIYGFQLALNVLWSMVFFGLRSPFFAFVEIAFLWISIAWTMIEFKKISRNAFYIMVPYIVWVSIALVLNISIVLLNP